MAGESWAQPKEGGEITRTTNGGLSPRKYVGQGCLKTLEGGSLGNTLPRFPKQSNNFPEVETRRRGMKKMNPCSIPAAGWVSLLRRSETVRLWAHSKLGRHRHRTYTRGPVSGSPRINRTGARWLSSLSVGLEPSKIRGLREW